MQSIQTWSSHKEHPWLEEILTKLVKEGKKIIQVIPTRWENGTNAYFSRIDSAIIIYE